MLAAKKVESAIADLKQEWITLGGLITNLEGALETLRSIEPIEERLRPKKKKRKKKVSNHVKAWTPMKRKAAARKTRAAWAKKRKKRK